jgi:pyruvate-ferredoxin/flavodoxin oxidoreductase
MSGVLQNQDAYMKGKIAQRYYYDQLAPALEMAMDQFHGMTGRHYGPVHCYRMDDAEFALVALGSLAEAAEPVADYLRKTRGIRVGVVHPTAFRPFPGPQLVAALKGVEAFAVIERMDNPSAQSNPLTAEIKAAFCDSLSRFPGYPRIDRVPLILSGSAGLGGRDVRPCDLIAVVDALRKGRREFFSLNIPHPTALIPDGTPDVRPQGAFSLRGYSVGGFGSVTANKVIAQTAGDLFGLHVQAYPKYGSEKKGLPTNYYLTLAREPIRGHGEMERAEFIPLNTVNALHLGDPLEGLSRHGIVFVQWGGDAAGLWAQFPPAPRRTACAAEAQVFFLDAARIAREEAPRPDLEVRMQGIVLLGVFLRCAPFREQSRLSDADLLERVGAALQRTFGKLSPAVVAANLRCVERGYREVQRMQAELMRDSGAGAGPPPVERRVAEVMHHGVITCGPEETLSKVAGLMDEQHISAVVVVNGKQEMEGIVSTTDLVRAQALALTEPPSPDLKPRHIMTRDVAVTWPEEPLATAIARMMDKRVHRLVVVPGPGQTHRPIGILSMTDVARTV